MLVVVLVIAIASALVIIDVGGDDRRVALSEASRLAGALEHAAALAQWRSQTLGVSAEGDRYRFWRRGEDGRWTMVADDDVLAWRAIPAPFTLVVIAYAGAPVGADAILPFRPSGRNEPFALQLASPAWAVDIYGDPLNRVQVAAHAASR
jgi:type II secretion system GspH-like protein